MTPSTPRGYYVLVSGLRKKPNLKLDGKPVACAAPHEFLEPEGRLILRLERPARVGLDF